MRRIVLDLEYHGQHFYGWQRQGPDRSVQATIEEALSDLLGHAVSVQAAGRTDRGVHACAMASHVDVETRLGPYEIMMAVNHRLPADVAVRRVREVDTRFHARFDATSKLYRYDIHRRRARSPLAQDRSFHCARSFDLAAMREAAARLTGSHDFASFQTNPQPPSEADVGGITVDTIGPAGIEAGITEPPPWRKPRPQGTVRTLNQIEIRERDSLLQIEVAGDGFLRGMVRALAGTLLEVALGRQDPAWIDELIGARDRKLAGPNLPAHGLTLIRVDYPPEPFDGRESSQRSA